MTIAATSCHTEGTTTASVAANTSRQRLAPVGPAERDARIAARQRAQSRHVLGIRRERPVDVERDRPIGQGADGVDGQVHALVRGQLSDEGEPQRRAGRAPHPLDRRHAVAAEANRLEWISGAGGHLRGDETRRRQDHRGGPQQVGQLLLTMLHRLDRPADRQLPQSRAVLAARHRATAEAIEHLVAPLVGGEAPGALRRALGSAADLTGGMAQGDPRAREPVVVEREHDRDAGPPRGGHRRRAEQVPALHVHDVGRGLAEQPREPGLGRRVAGEQRKRTRRRQRQGEAMRRVALGVVGDGGAGVDAAGDVLDRRPLHAVAACPEGPQQVLRVDLHAADVRGRQVGGDDQDMHHEGRAACGIRDAAARAVPAPAGAFAPGVALAPGNVRLAPGRVVDAGADFNPIARRSRRRTAQPWKTPHE